MFRGLCAHKKEHYHRPHHHQNFDFFHFISIHYHFSSNSSCIDITREIKFRHILSSVHKSPRKTNVISRPIRVSYNLLELTSPFYLLHSITFTTGGRHETHPLSLHIIIAQTRSVSSFKTLMSSLMMELVTKSLNIARERKRNG